MAEKVSGRLEGFVSQNENGEDERLGGVTISNKTKGKLRRQACKGRRGPYHMSTPHSIRPSSGTPARNPSLMLVEITASSLHLTCQRTDLWRINDPDLLPTKGGHVSRSTLRSGKNGRNHSRELARMVKRFWTRESAGASQQCGTRNWRGGQQLRNSGLAGPVSSAVLGIDQSVNNSVEASFMLL
ncbi:hypothetical protein Nepgr_008878 [Nepenthes gracilis]|uniref:Uncharacterized protein n=1 Tax=Nepenthes gracilis TaxID=150966 RepID=A0AAD3S9G3_NEPGR|nr:hypothetical protein Nepgr_008878 [Nepenthes gracilis]